MRSHQKVWLSSSTGHPPPPPPPWCSLPITLWLAGISWKNQMNFRSDFLFLGEGRFPFVFVGECLKRKPNCPFSPPFIRFWFRGVFPFCFYAAKWNWTRGLLSTSSEEMRGMIGKFNSKNSNNRKWLKWTLTCSATNSERRWVSAAIEDVKFPSSNASNATIPAS